MQIIFQLADGVLYDTFGSDNQWFTYKIFWLNPLLRVPQKICTAQDIMHTFVHRCVVHMDLEILEGCVFFFAVFNLKGFWAQKKTAKVA